MKKKKWGVDGFFNTFFQYCELFWGLLNLYCISSWLQRGFEKYLFWTSSIWPSPLKAGVGTFQLQKAPLLIAQVWKSDPSNTIWKDNHIFFSSAAASISYCQEASFGTETGHVGSQWLISSHCTLSAFSLNYLRQTSWLAATQTSDGLSMRRPEFGSH